MCGRFVSARKRLELLEEFGVERDRVAASPDPEPAPDYNVAPTKPVYAVVTRRPEDGRGESASGPDDSEAGAKAELREVSRTMTAQEISQAEAMAKACEASNYRACEY